MAEDTVVDWDVWVSKLTGGESNYGITGTQRQVIQDILDEWGDCWLCMTILHPDDDSCEDNLSIDREDRESLEWAAEWFELDLLPYYLPPNHPDLVALRGYESRMGSPDFRPFVEKAQLGDEFWARHST